MATKKKSAKAAGKTARVEVVNEVREKAKAKAKGHDSEHEITIAPAKGKLGVMIPGMGAVATTFVAGVEAIRKGLAKPIGSLTQMGTVAGQAYRRSLAEGYGVCAAGYARRPGVHGLGYF